MCTVDKVIKIMCIGTGILLLKCFFNRLCLSIYFLYRDYRNRKVHRRAALMHLHCPSCTHRHAFDLLKELSHFPSTFALADLDTLSRFDVAFFIYPTDRYLFLYLLSHVT